MADTIQLYSHDWPARAKQSPAERVVAANLRDWMARNPPSSWSDNRLEQAKHYLGIIFIAIRPIVDLAGSSSYEVCRRVRDPRNRTTFGPGGVVAKASAARQTQGRDEEYEPFDDLEHPLAHLLHRPNEAQTFQELGSKLMLQNRLTGVGPSWVVPNEDGKPVEMWALKTPFMYPSHPPSARYPFGAWQVNPYGHLWGYGMPTGFGIGGAILPNEQIGRWMEDHPLTDWDGYSPLTAAAIQMDVLQAIDESRKSGMDNGVNPSAVLFAPGMDPDVLQRAVVSLTDRGGGSRNSGKVLGLALPPGSEKGDLKLFGMSPRDMDYGNGWEQMVKPILATFGTSSVIAGLSEGSYSERYAARLDFYDRQRAVFGRYEMWLTKTLAWPWCEYPDEFLIRVKMPPVDNEELDEQKLQSDAANGTITYNLYQTLRDRPTVPGGDVPVPVYVAKVQQEHAADPNEPQKPDGSPDLSAQTPTGGDAPRPDNPQGKGSRPPAVGKSMNTMSLADGGALVPPVGSVRKKKKRVMKRIMGRVLKGLNQEPVEVK